MTSRTVLIFSATFSVLLAIFLNSCAEENTQCIEGDCKDGTGVLEKKFDDGGFVRYKGEFKDGKFVKGRMEYSTGFWYEGNFINNTLYGSGKSFSNDSAFYEGGFESSARHGSGILKFNDGSIYEGAFEYDFRTGKGKITYANGDVYDGDFHNNLFYGQGTFLWANTKVSYSGSWKNGRKDGQGKMTLANGDIQEGVWAADTLVTQTSNTTKKTRGESFDSGSLVLNFSSYSDISHANSLFPEETREIDLPGTIEINEMKKSITIRTAQKTTSYPILDKVVEAFDETFYYSEMMGSDGSTFLKFILRYAPEYNSFGVRHHFSKYNYYTDGPDVWSTVMNTKSYNLVK